MFRKLGRRVLGGLAILMFCVGEVSAGEIDLLVQKLVDKGVLTAGEARELITETKEEVKKQNAKGTNESIPAWVQTVKLKGDFRMRYEGNNQKGDSDVNRHRGRVRMRLGVEAKPNDQMKVGVGFSTGSTSNARSTNQTLPFDNSSDYPGASKTVVLDYAYGQYSPNNWVTLTAGRFKNPIWQTTDLLWDTDINPDGGAVQLQYTLSPGFDLFMNNMVMMLGETKADKTDPYMIAIQPGFSYSMTDRLSLKGALAYYAFNSVQGEAKFNNSKSTNTNGSPSTVYDYDYDSINPSLELGMKEPLGGVLPYAAVFVDYVSNISIDDKEANKNGYAAGIKFGAEKIAGRGDWQFKGIYARLDRDAFLDIFPDSDRYAGRTHMKSYEGILEYGLGKNSSLALDYYQSQSLTKSRNGGYQPERVVQVDWNLKF